MQPLLTDRTKSGVQITGLLGAAALILWWRWVGFQGHDDASYAAAAMSWVETSQPLGTTHWALRYLLVLPAALLISLFGPSVIALASINLVCYVFYLLTSYYATRRWFGNRAAVLATLAGIITPEFPVQATYMNPDLPEMALIVASFWALQWARRSGRSRYFFLCGLFVGCAFLMRETAVSFIAFVAVICIFIPQVSRAKYVIVIVGFALIISAQCSYFGYRTGDPFYREKISVHHDAVDRSSKIAAAKQVGSLIDGEGVLVANTFTEPLLAVFVSQKYGILFYIAIPAFFLLILGPRLSSVQRDIVLCAGAASAVSFLFVALAGGYLYIVPRYFFSSAAFAIIPASVCIERWLGSSRIFRVTAVAVLTIYSGSSLLLLYLENTDPMMASREIVSMIKESSVTVHVDPETLRRARFLFIGEDAFRLTSSKPPDRGDLVAVDAGILDECKRGCALPTELARFAPGSNWVELERRDPPIRKIGSLLAYFGFDRYIPLSLWLKIARPGSSVSLYYVW